jgi:ribosomal-protein-alanine N-acetyltransferase
MPVLDELHLLNLTVDPDHQGQGQGRRALQHLHATADAAAMSDVWLEVRASNARAQALYLSQGYAEVGRRRDYYPAGPLGREDALLMRRGGMRHD